MIEATTVGLIQETQCQWFEPKRLRSLLLTVDGVGSGIDADKLDGQEGSAFAKLTANTFTALQTVSGVAEGLRLIGTGTTGIASTSYMTFYDSDGATRRGVIGDYSVSNLDIILKSDTGALHLGDSTSNDVILLSSGDTKILGNIGFYNTTPVARPAAYTQTYATATRTHSNITAATPSAYAAGANGYSTGAKASEVHAAVVAHQTDIANIKQVLNQVIDDLQTLGLLQ